VCPIDCQDPAPIQSRQQTQPVVFLLGEVRDAHPPKLGELVKLHGVGRPDRGLILGALLEAADERALETDAKNLGRGPCRSVAPCSVDAQDLTPGLIPPS
jgi:hypothetical protein